MAWWVKGLLHEREDLGLDLLHPWKKPGIAEETCDASGGEKETRGFWELIGCPL